MNHPLCTKCLTDRLIDYMSNLDQKTMRQQRRRRRLIKKIKTQEFSRKSDTKTDISKTKIVVPETNNDQKKTWSIERLNQLSKPKKDYYEYDLKEVVTIRNHVNVDRMNYLATPRTRGIMDVGNTLKFQPKVQLSVLLPRIERMLTPLKRSDGSEHIKTNEEIFSVKKSALKYVATERIKQLATPRPLYPEE